MLRPSRLLAVARYEVRSHMTGRQALRLLGVAAALMIPAGAVVLPKVQFPARPPVAAAPGIVDDSFVGPPLRPKIPVRGEIPPALADRLQLAERAPVAIRGQNPVVVTGLEVSKDLRQALETLDGPVELEHRGMRFPARLPGRSLLIAILAISLLTGPLADALPGERARRTLEVLLTAGITRGELIGGKWFAWTASATLTALVSAGIAIWRGVQEPGLWLFGLPLFIGSAVAFGLWLVRLVDDVVGGSATPMRVLPVAAGGMAALARALSGTSPIAAAAVPLGGPLLVAADLFSSGPQLVAATVSTGLFLTVVLTRTGRDLDRTDIATSPTRWGALGLSMLATLLWWLTVAGPGVWGAGASGVGTDLVTPLARSMMVGGIALLACAAIAIAREPRRTTVVLYPTPNPLFSIVVAVGVASALAASGPLPALDLEPALPAIDVMLARLRGAAIPQTMLLSAAAAAGAMLSILGQAVLFRSVLATRLGWKTSGVLWAIAVSPWAPWSALPGSLALAALAEAHGWWAALCAHLLWSVAISWGVGMGVTDGASLVVQMIAFAIAFGALRFARGVPIRHQL